MGVWIGGSWIGCEVEIGIDLNIESNMAIGGSYEVCRWMLRLDAWVFGSDIRVEDWFYTGQKRYGMTINEHINDLRDRVDVNLFGPIGRPKADTNIDKEPLTRERIESMSADEAIKPLIDGVFGSLLEYAEDSPTSRKTLSGFIKETPDLVDKNRAGNNSFFGEDWGAPNRFHQSRRNQSSSYDPSRIY